MFAGSEWMSICVIACSSELSNTFGSEKLEWRFYKYMLSYENFDILLAFGLPEIRSKRIVVLMVFSHLFLHSQSEDTCED